MKMNKILITMVWLRNSSLVNDKPFVNVLSNLHLDFANALKNLISYIQRRQDANKDDQDLVHIHMVLLHICWPPTCPVVQ
jgi:hypothetical protein